MRAGRLAERPIGRRPCRRCSRRPPTRSWYQTGVPLACPRLHRPPGPLRAHHMDHEAEDYPAMNESTTDIPIVPPPEGRHVLTEALRDGARRMPAQAVEAEVAAWTGAICKGMVCDVYTSRGNPGGGGGPPGPAACAESRLGSPRLNEPEDHAEVGDPRLRHRRRQAGQEIPVVAQVRAQAGGQRHAGPVRRRTGGCSPPSRGSR